jgi:hypothetical protein
VARAREPAEPVLGVGGIAGLGHLAVVDDVDAGRRLLAHDLGHRRADARGERRRVDGDAFFLGEHGPDQIVGAGQAARVRGEKALGALLHRARIAEASGRRNAREPRLSRGVVQHPRRQIGTG